MLTREELSKVLDYDSETGAFTWLVNRGPATPGKSAGHLSSVGYWQIGIDGDLFYGHRLAWLYVHGIFPPPGIEIDHINMVKDDNRIANLRLATWSQQGGNTGLRNDNTSGAKGVHWFKQTQKWQAGIRVNGRQVHLGFFDEKDDAISAYAVAAEKHFGEFARTE